MSKLYVLNGPEMGKSFGLKDGPNYIGRSPENDIQIRDRTVSRKHLRITKKGDKYLIADLGSKNGTFFKGNYLARGIEVQIEQGTPMAIGMSVICLGKGCVEQIMPFLESIELTTEIGEQSGIFLEHKEKTNQKKLELLYKVSDILGKNVPIKDALQKVLDNLFDFLRRIDRGAFILLDPDTKEVREIIFRSKKPVGKSADLFCKEVVDEVLARRGAIAVSDAKAQGPDEIADTLRVHNIESVMCVPLMGVSQIVGVIYIDSVQRPFGFQKEDLSLFMDLGHRIACAVENAMLMSELLPFEQ